ncbi:hypothetical protein FBU59_004506 [Linderina macrospora]|uniref:Uncharacterized protein n=1 Tax=Linderina macrospora TaxID=4868 RepID=A0ACC1J5D0_9FUNG|nr:hypothetical protein FBU59_004506 [Linderina macrospora]
MGVYMKAFVVLVGGLLGGSVGFYYQSKEDSRLRDLRRMKMDEMKRVNQETQQPEAADKKSADQIGR